MAKRGEKSSDEHRRSGASSPQIDLEYGTSEKTDKDCRICHLSLESNMTESDIAIVLGCSCKNDLAAAHKQCAEAWFKIKGNKTCEICGSTAKNMLSSTETGLAEHIDETGNGHSDSSATESQSFWQGHRFLNFLLGCMIFAFLISWLFHYTAPV